MIPDKIYINGFSAFATEPVKDGIEYIRKDALMEWLNAKANDYGHTTPFRIAIQCTIDKINEL